MHLVESHKKMGEYFLSNKNKKTIGAICECGDADAIIHSFNPKDAYQEILAFAKKQRNIAQSKEVIDEFARLCLKQNLITQEEHSRLDDDIAKIQQDITS